VPCRSSLRLFVCLSVLFVVSIHDYSLCVLRVRSFPLPLCCPFSTTLCLVVCLYFFASVRRGILVLFLYLYALWSSRKSRSEPVAGAGCQMSIFLFSLSISYTPSRPQKTLKSWTGEAVLFIIVSALGASPPTATSQTMAEFLAVWNSRHDIVKELKQKIK
jgi:hypothetical protein